MEKEKKYVKLFERSLFFLKKTKKFGLNQLEKIENTPISFNAWFISFICFVFLRNFLETFSSGFNFLSLKSWPFFFLHSTSSYFFIFLFFIIALHFITRERIEKISRSSLWLTPWLLLAPIVDKIFFNEKYVPIKYLELQASNFSGMIQDFYNFAFFGPNGLLQFAHNFWGWGGDEKLFSELFSYNFGLKMELAIITFWGMIYVFLKTKKIWRTLLFLVVERLIMFIASAFPFFVTVWLELSNNASSFYNISQINPNFSWNFVLFSLFSIFIIIFGIIWFWRYNQDKFLALFKNLRIERLALYLGAFYYGIYLAGPNFKFNFFDILIIITGSLAITLSWLFAVGSNDLADEKGDKLSKSHRPLPARKLTREEVKNLNLIFRVASYLLAFAAGYAFFLTILIRSAISYLYSNPPFRLKKIPFVSTFCIASAVTLGTLGGYLLFTENTVFDFSGKLIIFLLTFFTLGLNFIHINDFEGDKKEGVWTLPVIFGEIWGKRITGLCLSTAFLSTLFFYPTTSKFLLILVLLISIAGFWIVNKKKFNEKHVFILCSIFALLFILFFEKPL